MRFDLTISGVVAASLAVLALVVFVYLMYQFIKAMRVGEDKIAPGDPLQSPDRGSLARATKEAARISRNQALRDKAAQDGFTRDRLRKLRKERDLMDSYDAAIMSPRGPGSLGYGAGHLDSGDSRSGGSCSGFSGSGVGGSDSGGSSGGGGGGSCGGGGGGD